MGEEERRRDPPSNNRHPRQCRQTTKHKRHDTPGREPLRQASRRFRRVGQVQKVFFVAGGIAGGGDVLGFAGVEVGWWDGEGLLEEGGGFDDGGDKAGRDVPFDVAVEEPDAWRGG